MTDGPVTLKGLRERTRADVGDGRRRRVAYLTQEEVADAAGLDRSVYTNLERGKRTLTGYYAALLAPVLGPQVAELARDEPGPRPPTPLEELAAGIRDLLTGQAEVLRRLRRLESARGGAPPQRQAPPRPSG